MHIRISNKIGFTAKIFGVAWTLNLLWEFAQKPLYLVGNFPPFIWEWIRATTWDAAFIVVLYLMLAILHNDFYWLRRKNIWDLGFIFLIGFTVITFMEQQALGAGGLFYSSAMPIVPILKIGLTPFLQLPLLAFLTYWFARFSFSKYFE
ncbi:MAG: hypothetical protein LiPW15_109 [Parcubacteria group bacterium LiPW_15]|nr:MAG: hypothetical protein LiPW15_109 [Parcubacteria group bacterium LiPW_15]